MKVTVALLVNVCVGIVDVVGRIVDEDLVVSGCVDVVDVTGRVVDGALGGGYESGNRGRGDTEGVSGCVDVVDVTGRVVDGALGGGYESVVDGVLMVSGFVDVVDVVTCGCDRCGRQLCGCGGCEHESGGGGRVKCAMGHKLVVVEADGNYITPFTTDDIDIYSGETYSVLLTTDQDPSKNYYISVGVRGRKPNTPPALTVLNYVTAPSSQLPASPPPETPRWNDFDRSKNFSKKIFAGMGSPSPPETFNERLILLNTQNLIDGFTKWAINNVSLAVPGTPYLMDGRR
ncbi:hypothetical protein F2Q68_00007623 [Brassica cretica]|uniref:Plastocyanin-like domain-containing protein n=1 Tax=Brassica cretica TaxID=69181 RepID=A0A8S9KY30_BRACR|nr:hypothetical protein F2Q68_00007623 [Brassica cretica]